MKYENGITLLALVVTIVLLILLSAISINSLIGENGIITKARTVKEIQEKTDEKERLRIVIPEVIMDYQRNPELQEYIDKLIDKGMLEKDTIEKQEDGSIQGITDHGYLVEIKQEESGDIIIEVIDKIEKVPPKIVNIEVHTKTNEITLQVNAKWANQATYTFWYKEMEQEEYKKIQEGKSNKCVVEHLLQNQKYWIKVEVKTKNDKVQKEITETTGEIPTDMIQMTKPKWNENTQKASITISTSVEGYQLQYATAKEGPWITIESGTTIPEQENNTTIFARLFDGNNESKIYASMKILDETPPTVPTISYIGGSNTCTWKNNYHLKLTSKDPETGIARYEMDTNLDDVVDSVVGSDFIPQSGFNFCNVRFRSVNKVGVASQWSEVQHIHMDTTSPTVTNWWWGEVNTTIARLYIQCSDAGGSGINRLQCPTSTLTGGNSNWIWFNTVWDVGANAWRADITPSRFGHYAQNYLTHLYLYDNAGNGGYMNQTSCYIPANVEAYKYDRGTWGSEGYVTIRNPASDNDPCIAYASGGTGDIAAGIKINDVYIKAGDRVNVVYRIERSNNEWCVDLLDCIKGGPTDNSLEFNVSYNNNNNKRNVTYTATRDVKDYWICICRNACPNTNYRAKLFIYSISVNGRRII